MLSRSSAVEQLQPTVFGQPRRPDFQRTIDSPVGPLTLMGGAHGLTHLLFDHQVDRVRNQGDDPEVDDQAFPIVVAQLDEYFMGRRRAFGIEVAPSGTPFQLDVWQALTTIPYGATWSYGELAERIGRRGAARAVGAANGQNPISIIVPCHRVIGASGKLTGYGGGLDRKEHLLGLEHAVVTPQLSLLDR